MIDACIKCGTTGMLWTNDSEWWCAPCMGGEIERLRAEDKRLREIQQKDISELQRRDQQCIDYLGEIERLRAGLVVLADAEDKARYYRDCPDSLPQTVALAKVILEAAEAAKETD